MIYKLIIIIILIFSITGCNVTPRKENITLKKDTTNQTSERISGKDSSRNVKPTETPSGVITRLPTDDKIIALTFDACETRTPAYFDERILSFLLKGKIPFTVFVSGKFAVRNKGRLTELSKLEFVEIENHSLNHYQNMERLSKGQTEKEVTGNEKLIFDITKSKTKFFRFPGGNYNQAGLESVESLGHKVVHWDVASGDPDKRVSAGRLIKWVLYNVKPGSIIIFHINGRGYKTADALPVIVDSLRNRGYRFVKLDEEI